MKINKTKIWISNCIVGIYLRWFFNGWHYWNFTNGYEIEMNTESMGIQVTNYFSVISKIERDTRIKTEYSYKITVEGIHPFDIAGFAGLLMAEKVEQYEDGLWREVDITRGDHLIKNELDDSYIFNFEITRKELPNSSSVYQKSLRLYIGDTLLDMDDDEIVPINKQVNNIAEMQDRQSDFTAQFKVRKTRSMRSLFELSGEVGATTQFPYQRHECKLIQDNIEVITGGILVLDDVDEQYYYVSIMSGNANFFNLIAGKKITDLLLPATNHTWSAAFMAATHSATSPGIDVVYPLCEPSDDGSIAPLNDDGDKVEMYGGWIWPFVRIQTIWEEIFANAGFIVTGGEVLSSDIFQKLFMPIASRDISDTTKYLYSEFWGGFITLSTLQILGEGYANFLGVVQNKGDNNFRLGYYVLPYDGTYKFTVTTIHGSGLIAPVLDIFVYMNGVYQGTMAFAGATGIMGITHNYEFELTAGVANESITLIVQQSTTWYFWFWAITEIVDAKIAYGSYVESRLYLPDMTQTDFVKMICNLFGLVPDVTPKDRKIRFWNYSELYDNLFIARNWSAYLSERDDKTGFKFGDYAQHNFLKYKQSDDVITDQGKGDLIFNDETLPEDKDMIQLALSTCDEVRILTTNFPVDVSRIAFNKWNDDDAVYDAEDKIDPRIVYIDFCREIGSPLYQKAFWIRPTVNPLAGSFAAPSEEILTPKIAQSLEIAFSNLIYYYSSLSRLLTKPNIRKAKFNLPVYEVAGLKHNVPIYLSQYKAYFYVNKISNYVAGQLCTVELIRL